MNRTFRLLSVLLVLLAIAGYFYCSEHGGGQRRAARFAITDTAGVDRVLIIAESDSLFLDRTGRNWTVNGEYRAMQRSVSSLLYLFLHARADLPVPGSDIDRVLGEFRANGKEIRVYSGNKLLKDYAVVYDSTAETSYMMNDGSGTPFRVYLPGFRITDLAALFRTGAMFWRDRTLISLPSGGIASVRVEHRHRPGTSFFLSRDQDGKWLLTDPGTGREVPGLSGEHLHQYLGYFSRVVFDDFVDPDTLARADTLGGTSTSVIVNGTDGHTTSIDLIPRYDAGGTIDPDRLYCRVNGRRELVLASYVRVGPIARDISYFTR